MKTIISFIFLALIATSTALPVEQALDSKVEYVRPRLLPAPIAPIPLNANGKNTLGAPNTPIHRVDIQTNGVFGPTHNSRYPEKPKVTFDLTPAESAHWGGGCAGGCGGGWGGGGWGHHHHHHGGWGHHHGGGWGHHHGWHHG